MTIYKKLVLSLTIDKICIRISVNNIKTSLSEMQEKNKLNTLDFISNY